MSVSRAVAAVVCVAITSGGGGCGATPSAHQPPKVKQLAVAQLAREPVSSGAVSLSAELYEFEGATYLSVKERTEEPSAAGKPQVGGPGSGPSMKPGEYGRLLLNVSHGCVGHTPYALAFGLLRSGQDTLTAREGSNGFPFSRATIPQRFHASGLLVYRLLGQGPAEVVLRTPNGHVMSRETYAGRAALTCRGA